MYNIFLKPSKWKFYCSSMTYDHPLCFVYLLLFTFHHLFLFSISLLTHFHLVPRLRISGATFVVPTYAFTVRTGTYLSFLTFLTIRLRRLLFLYPSSTPLTFHHPCIIFLIPALHCISFSIFHFSRCYPYPLTFW